MIVAEAGGRPTTGSCFKRAADVNVFHQRFEIGLQSPFACGFHSIYVSLRIRVDWKLIANLLIPDRRVSL